MYFIEKIKNFLKKKQNTVIRVENAPQPIFADYQNDRLFDFKNYGALNDTIVNIESNVSKNRKKRKKKVKSISVLNELIEIPNPISLKNLDEKIKMFEIKETMTDQYYSKNEITGFKNRLINRKQYEENKEFFEKFKNTTEENIDKLLDKYDLVLRPIDIFISTIPDYMIALMEEYTKKCMELFDKKPVYYVIATADCFKEAYKRNDPIFLVQSPFGFYWQILGACDEEMLILHEL